MTQNKLVPTLFILSALFGHLLTLGQPNTSLSKEIIFTSPPPIFSQIVPLAELGYTDETVQGVLVNRTYSINWPNAWIPQPGNSLTVEFSHSPILERYSSMAVDWNGVRLGSILLSPENTNRGRLKVNIPESEILIGYNQLRLEFYMGIYDDPCEDPNNPATWSTIHSSSFFEFSYDLSTPVPDLNLYPLPILDNSNLVENNLTFIIPENPSLAEVNAVAVISAKLGQLASWRSFNLDVISETWLDTLGTIQGDIMYIGRSDHLSVLKSLDLPFTTLDGDNISFTTLEGEQLEPQAGIIWEQVSRMDATAAEFIVTGADDQAVLLAAKGLASEKVYPRLHGQLGVVYDIPEPPSLTDGIQQSITLEELGYRDQTARGTYNQIINYVIPLSMEWQVMTEAILELHFAHSELLNPDRSSLTVSMNGSPIGSILLTQENSENGYATFRLPARLLEIGDNKITITTNIKVLDTYIDRGECTEDYYHEAWVVVYSDSRLQLPTGPRSLTLDLADFPYGFIGIPNLSDTAFVVPDPMDRSLTHAVGIISSRLGRFSEGTAVEPKIIPADASSNLTDIYPNQILIGQPTQNQAIYQLNEILPLPFVEGSNTPQRIDEIANIWPPAESIGYIQAALTADNHPRLIVTGDGTDGVLWAAEALSDPKLSNDLKGDLVILDARASIFTSYINQPSSPPITQQPEDGTPSSVSMPAMWVLWAAGIIFIITLIILFVIAWPLFIRRRQLR